MKCNSLNCDQEGTKQLLTTWYCENHFYNSNYTPSSIIFWDPSIFTSDVFINADQVAYDYCYNKRKDIYKYLK